jgi:prepilin signal peptidase PulO-like enzyme (type II secretory pathway)
MLVLSYILIFFSLGMIAYGLMVRTGDVTKVPGYKPDPKVEVREEDLKRYAGKNLLLVGMVDLIIAVAMFLMEEDNLVVFLLVLLFNLFIIYAIRYAAKLFIMPKN